VAIVIRAASDADVDAIISVDEQTFGFSYSDEARARVRAHFEMDRMLVALDHEQVVGSTGAWTFTVVMPGGRPLPAAGVTWVGVSPTHRRRGLLRSFMTRQLDDVLERGEPLALLTASESGIYGRFGYGVATQRARMSVDPRRVHLRGDVAINGDVRLVDAVTARKVLPELWDRSRRPGTLSRNDRWWDHLLADPPEDRDGASPRFHAVHRDGFVSYRVRNHTVGGHFDNQVMVHDLLALTPDAYGALWGFLLGLDLAGRIEWARAATDEPLPWMVDQPRQVQTTGVDDDMWARILDVPAVLTARSYGADDRLVLEVMDAFRPGTGGRFELEGGAHGAACRRTTAPPDVALDVADLGTLVFGLVPASRLAGAGRLDERTPGAVTRAGRLFSADPTPHNTTPF
jgi:predicted acetyltransferase